MADTIRPERSVTLQDIADRCGVTRMTVWRALNNDLKRVSKATHARILAMAEELQYDPHAHQAASRLVNRRTGKSVLNQVVAVLFPEEFHSAYFKCLLEGVMETLMPVDYGMLLYRGFRQEAPLPVTFRRGDVDGLIVYQSFRHFRPSLEKLRATPSFGDRPIVTLLEKVPDCAAVLTDDFAGGYAAVSHLLDLGHRHLLYDNLDHQAHHRRQDGYRQAFHDRGLSPDEGLVPANWDGEQDFVGVKLKLLQAHPEITGVLAAFDEQAVRLCQALAGQGKRVPDDYSVVGFDDTDILTDRQGNSLLTTVRVPLEQIGLSAAQLVLRQLTGHADGGDVITLPTELVVRQTTAPPKR